MVRRAGTTGSPPRPRSQCPWPKAQRRARPDRPPHRSDRPARPPGDFDRVTCKRIECLSQRPAGGQDIVDDQHPRARRKRRSAAEFSPRVAVRRSFGIGGHDAQLTCHFECEDDAASRGPNDDVDLLISEAIRDDPADLRGRPGLAQEVELFDVLVAMAARREDEVTLLERTRCAQRLEDAACCGHACAS